ncbi:hypothetical protein QYF36_010334 [Acer negundo]|nr:hypothetical protein QYF36_010334 [Acer negundo]
MEDDVDHDHEGARNCDDELDSVSHLFKTQRYSDRMHNLEVALRRESNDNDYQLIVDCNASSVEIDNEIVAVHNFIRDKYWLKFPELESTVRHSIDYAGVVKKIGNEMDHSIRFCRDFVLGYLEKTEAFQATPPYLRSRAYRPLAAKSTLAVRVDSARRDPSGSTGRALREAFYNKIEKWQEPPPAKLDKPLSVPDSEPKKKKRGGCRSRKMKERYAITDMRKMANKMLFGVPEECYLGAGYGNGYGMLGQVGFGKLRVSVTWRKLSVAKKLSKGRR